MFYSNNFIEAFKEKMGEEIKEVDLDQAHRLGAPKEDKVRPVIVKLARYNTVEFSNIKWN